MASVVPIAPDDLGHRQARLDHHVRLGRVDAEPVADGVDEGLDASAGRAPAAAGAAHVSARSSSFGNRGDRFVALGDGDRDDEQDQGTTTTRKNTR